MNSTRFRRDQGHEFKSDSVTVQMMFDAYEEYAEEKGRSSGTLKIHKLNFNRYVKKFYKDADMTLVTQEEHQIFLQSLKKKGISPATRNRIRSLIRVLYSVAIEGMLFGGVFKINPFDFIKPALEPKKAIKYLTQDQADKLLEANLENHYYPLILLLLKTGLRIGEALGIHQEQIDRKTGMLVVDRQFDKSQGSIVYRTKGKRVRVVYLIDEVLDVLPRDEGLLFKNLNGTNIKPDYFLRVILPEACGRAGIKKIHTHGLRHSFAAHYLMNGGSIWDLSKILGHYSVNITEEYYAHFSLDHIRNRMKIIEKKNNVIKAAFGGGGH